MRFPAQFPHSLADIPILVVASVTNIITADGVNRLSAKQDCMAVREFRDARLFPWFGLLKPHSPARENAIGFLGNNASMTGTNVQMTSKVVVTRREPVFAGKNFTIDTGQEGCIRTLDRGVSGGRNALILRKTNETNPSR